MHVLGIWIWIWTALGIAVLAVLLGLCWTMWKRRERRELDLMVMRDVQAWNLPLPTTVIPIEGWDDWDWDDGRGSINAQAV